MSKRPENLVAAIYFHPEAYPPTLNATDSLSNIYDQISVVHRPHMRAAWNYPSNVKLVPSGTPMSADQQKLASLPKKFLFFLAFMRTLLRECRRTRPSVILVYDTMSLYAYHLIRKFLGFPHRIWYHNHDVVERGLLRKYSVGWFAANAEKKTFDYLDIFSLPTDDRLAYFPMDHFKGRYFLIPNFPSLHFYGKFYQQRAIGETVRLIFQGQVGPQRGIEELLPVLAAGAGGKQVELGLIGPCDEAYKQAITALSEQHGVRRQVYFSKLPYIELPAFSATFHIGLALLSEKNIMTATIGTASNKVYEYAALGLPVLYNKTENLERHLGQYAWAVSTEVKPGAIGQKIAWIVQAYDQLSAAAHHDFTTKLNYETGFGPVKTYLEQLPA